VAHRRPPRRRTWLRGFVPWNELAKIEYFETDVDGTTFVSWRISFLARGMKAITLSDAVHQRQAAAFIEARIALSARPSR
jgi:hypothetical protein